MAVNWPTNKQEKTFQFVPLQVQCALASDHLRRLGRFCIALRARRGDRGEMSAFFTPLKTRSFRLLVCTLNG